MPITDEQIQKFKRHYDSKAKTYACTICGADDWQPENIVPLPHLEGGTLDMTQVAPVMPLRCKNCQHTLFFNAKLIGLLD